MIHIFSRRENTFETRKEAGKLLGRELSNKFPLGENTVVLGIPRGGLVVAQSIADFLNVPFDIILSVKLSSPDEPEFAIGAITEDGNYFIDESIRDWISIDERFIEEEKKRKLQLLANRKKTYRTILSKMHISGKTIIIADDGLATGASMKAALLAARQEKPATLIAAIPVGSINGLQRIDDFADDVLCLFAPSSFHAVGEYYRNFEQIYDDDVCAILKKAEGSRLIDKVSDILI